MKETPSHSPGSYSDVPPRRSGMIWLKVLVVLGIGALAVALLLPSVRTSGEAARRNSCVNKLKQLALALHNYHDVYHVLPPAFTVDENGKPLHSWRTLILPYLEKATLHQSIDLTKPWNDPVNAKAINSAVDAFQCPSSAAPENHTNYVAIIAPDSCIRPNQSRKLSDISDGIGRTILLVEVPAKRTVPWMTPEDISEEQFLEVMKAGETEHSGGIFMVAIADGSVRSLTTDISTDLFHALITASGKEDSDLPE